MDVWRFRSTRRGTPGSSARLAVNVVVFALFGWLVYSVLSAESARTITAPSSSSSSGGGGGRRGRLHVGSKTSSAEAAGGGGGGAPRRGGSGGGGDDDPPAIPAVPVVPTHDVAYVTMASGNEAGRMATVLVRSLLDAGTSTDRVDIVVLLPRGGVHSPECQSPEWRKARNLTNPKCGDGGETIPEEVISPHLVDALRRMGAKLALIDPIPSTPMTEGIPGGRASFWGMALNKLVVFNMTQYRKVIWMDSDTYALKNLDHLFGPEYPTFTGAITEACCLNNGPGIPSGGLWVLEPSRALGLRIWRMMEEGAPVFNKTGFPVLRPDGTQEREYWRLGDMHIVRHLFSDWPRDYSVYNLWPWMVDVRHGHPAGLRQLPMYAAMSDAQFADAITDPRTREPYPEGFRPERVAPADAGRPVWRALPIVYDQCVSQCICLPWRWPAPSSGVFYSIHFSCLQEGISKPGHYATEEELMRRLADDWNCNKHYWLMWYDTYQRAVGGRLAPPLWTGPDVRATINYTSLNHRPTRIIAIPKREDRASVGG